MKRLMGLAIIILFMVMPVPGIAQDFIYPIVSIETMVNPHSGRMLVNDMSNMTSVNYTAICRTNSSNANIRIEFANDTDYILDRTYFSINNFTIFSFRLINNVSKFDLFAENDADSPANVILDLYNQTLENLQGMTFIISPDIFPVEYVLITQNVTVLVEVPKEKVIITDFQAIMVGFGGFCVLAAYVMFKNKKEEEKPIKKLTLDDLLEEFRKGK